MNISVELVTVLTGATTVLISIVGYLVIRLIRSYDKAQESNVEYQVKTTKEMNEIKFNYLDRFDKVKNQIMESEVRIINNIAGQFRHKVNSDDV